jgi:hypothetical protein
MHRTGLVLLFSLIAVTSAVAAGDSPLTGTDLKYLKTLGQSSSDLAGLHPSAAMLDKLHALINDPATAQKPKARSEAVYRWLDHIQAQSLWCADHPKDKDCDASGGATATAAAP